MTLTQLKQIVSALYFFASVIFLNFGLPILPIYQVTIAVIYPLIFLTLGHVEIRLKGLIALLAAILFPIVTYSVALALPGQLDFIRFVRTYTLFLHFFFGMFVCLNIAINPNIMRAIDKAILAALIVVLAFSLLQITGTLITEAPFLYNPFGEYGIGGEYDPYRFLLGGGAVRPAGFYWEPSTNSLVVFMLTCYLMVRNFTNVKRYLAAQFGGQLIILSSTGLVASGVTVILWLNAILEKRLFLRIAVILGVAGTVIGLSVDRLAELLWPGTSGYFRWAIPAGYFLEYIDTYPLGLPLGQIPPSTDNGLFVALIYTGVFGLMFFSLFLMLGIINYLRGTLSVQKQITVMSIVLLMIFNGAFFTPEMSFLISLMLVAWRHRPSALPLSASVIRARLPGRVAPPAGMRRIDCNQ